MNKKGFIGGTFISLALALIIIIGVIAFLAPQTLRFTLIGIAIIIGSFVYAVPAALSGDFTREKFIFLVFLFGIGILVMFVPKLGLTQQLFIGATTTTISTDGQRVVITATPGGDRLAISLTNSELNQELKDSGFRVDRGVEIEIKSKSLKKVYPLVTTNDFFKTLDWKNVGDCFGCTTFTTTQDLIEECREDRSRPLTIHAFLDNVNAGAFYDIICVEQKPFAKRAHIQGEVIDEFNIEVDVGGVKKSLTRDTSQQTFYNGDIKVEYIGAYVAPEQLSQVPYDIQWTNGQFNFLINTNALAKQNEAYNTYQSCVGIYDDVDPDDRNANYKCITTYLNAIQSATQNQNTKFAPTLVTSLNFVTESLDKGRMEAIVVPSSTIIPLIRIIVDGEFLGFTPLSGKPQIQKVNGQCFEDIDTEAGDTDNMQRKMVIKNIGNEDAKFYISRVCTNTKLDALLLSSVDIDKGAQQELGVTITGAQSTQGSVQEGECTITVTDRNDNTLKDSCSFGISIDYATVECTSDQISCSEDKKSIVKCNSLGTGSEIIESCGEGNQCGLNDDGVVACVKTSLIDKLLEGGGAGEAELTQEELDLECTWYQKKVIREGEKKSWYNYIGIGKPQRYVETSCVIDPSFTLVGIAVIAMIFIITMLKVLKPTKRKKK